MARHLSWNGESSGTDWAFAAVRIAVGLILMWGALTKLGGGGRIEELAAAWTAMGVDNAYLLVTASIWLQLLLAALLLVGLFTRAAGFLNGLNFAAAATISGIFTAGVNWWPFALLILLLLHFAILGAGGLSLDGLRRRRLALSRSADAVTLDDFVTAVGLNPGRGGNYPGGR